MRPRLAYLHLPKAAGTSIRAALSAYYDADETAPWSFDRLLFGDFDRIGEIPQPVFLGDPSELGRYSYLEGHWSLPTILAAFEPGDVACVVREPRSRYLSQYTFWRSRDDAYHETWAPFDLALGARRPLSAYADDPRLACISDNLVTRLLVGEHDLIPIDAPIAASDIDAVAALACAEVDRLGFVDVVERGEDTYRALEDWFGSPLSRERLNETDLDLGEPVDIDDLLDRRTLALVNDRSAADLQVWHHVLERRGPSHTAARGLADATYGRTLATIAARHAAGHRPEPRPVEGAAMRADGTTATGAIRPPATRRFVRLIRRGPRAWRDRIRDEIDHRRGRGPSTT